MYSSLWLTLIIALLEYATPVDYVFGYLYSIAIILIAPHGDRRWILGMTALAILLTLANLVVPASTAVALSQVANRGIASLALLITGILVDRHQRDQAILIQQEAQLQSQARLTQQRDDFVATLTHDLKTPLLGAITTLEHLEQGHWGSLLPTQMSVLETLKRSQVSTLHLVETLLEIYRIESEGLPLHLERMDLVTLADEVIAHLTALATARRVHLRVVFANSDFRQALWVMGDPVHLRRVVENLVSNAIYHSPRGGRVDLILVAGSPWQQLRVIDSGAGIDPADLPHIFERFYQGQGQHHRTSTGLGLYLSRQIIHAHGGDIGAESSPKGTTFQMRLPAV
ncbi:MAG: HAMP domain-containing sensor histidine kinase [Synechococcales cyanobacterium]